MPYAPFEVSKWVHMLKGVSSKSARGSCGFSVQELKSIPVSMLQALFDLFHALEAGAAWPEALVFALVVCLPQNRRCMYRPSNPSNNHPESTAPMLGTLQVH